MNTMSKRIRMMAALGVLSLTFAACGGSDDATEAEAPVATQAETPAVTQAEGPVATGTNTPAPTGDLAEGDVFVTGSSTVEPISIKVGEKADELSGGKLAVTVEGPGTGDGFKKFCAGEGDVTGASRKIKDEEAQTCADAGIEFTEIEVAIDGLTVATNVNNAAVECLDVAALYALIGPESEGFSNWSDANVIAAEVGSAYAELPDAELVITGPGEESGTYDTFVEFAIADLAEERGAEEFTRADYAASANDNLIVEGIEGSETSLGWLGYAYYVGEQDKMKAISIVGEDGSCVAPTTDSIGDGSYPFSRSLFIYVNKANAAENPAVASYVDLYVSEGIATLSSEAGYVALPADRAAASAAAWTAG